MFYSKKVIIKKIIREYDKDGKVVRERTVLNDGGLGQEEAEKQLKESDKAFEKMDKTFEDMDKIFEDMDKLFKDAFK